MKDIPLNIENFTNTSKLDLTLDDYIDSNNIKLKTITLSDIKKSDKLYTFSNKYVFDLTNYISKHPGGSIIMNCKGKNIISVWKEMGYSWHLHHTNVINVLKDNIVGLFVENYSNINNESINTKGMDTEGINKLSVYDNRNKTRLNFRTLFNKKVDEKYHKYLSLTDYLYLGYKFGKFVTSDNRRKEYYNVRLEPLLKNNLSKYGYHYVADFVAGPGAGFDKNTMSLGHYANFAKLSYGKPAWQVMNQPTSEAWIEPWAKYLKSKGVVFHMNYKLDEFILSEDKKSIRRAIVIDNINKKNTKLIMKGMHILAINPNNIAEIMMKSKMKEFPIFQKLSITNNQISYRIGFNKKIKFKNGYNSFVLVDSPYNITFYPQDIMWEKNINLGMNGKILSLWSGTLILPYNMGSLYGKPASILSKKELLDEIIHQHFESNELKDVIINKKDFVKENIIYTELFEDWNYDGGMMKTINKKWVNTNINQQYRPTEKTNYNNMLITGSHCKTNVDIWSMEGAVESGLNCSKLLLKKYNMKDDITIIKHDDNSIISFVKKIDNIFYKLNMFQLIDMIIILLVILIIYNIYKKRYIFMKK